MCTVNEFIKEMFTVNEKVKGNVYCKWNYFKKIVYFGGMYEHLSVTNILLKTEERLSKTCVFCYSSSNRVFKY